MVQAKEEMMEKELRWLSFAAEIRRVLCTHKKEPAYFGRGKMAP